VDKSPEAFRTISEVADTLDVPTHVLRFWESRFAQVKPVKRGGGRRYYRPEDVRLLRGIRGLLYDEGMTIKGVQKILRERGLRHVIVLGTLPGGEPEPRRPSGEGPPPGFDETEGAFDDAPEQDAVEAFAIETPEIETPGPFESPVPAEEAVMAETPPAPPQPADAPQACATHVPDRQALRALIAELEALRAVMVSDRP
jgi:DNA-binding transcriptional MerR regulator